MFKYTDKYKERVLKAGFQEVIDQDFNPDIVKCFGYEMFETGFKYGILVGGAGVLGFFIGNYVGKKIFGKTEEPNLDEVDDIVKSSYQKPEFDVKLK